jgi:DNA-binding response OmpR family regulator
MREAVPHILIVDDDPSIKEGLTLALRGAYVVHGAATGDEACAALEQHPIAGIILDVLLGKEHGLDLVGRFRAISPAPILVLTAYGSEEVAARALRAGVSDYLRKPFNLEDLKASLSRLVR